MNFERIVSAVIQLIAHEAVIFCGVALLIASYLLLAIRALNGESLAYYFTNLVAAGLVLTSLLVSSTVPAAVVVALWVAISGVGVAITVLRPTRRMRVTVTNPHRGPRTAETVRRGMQPLIDSFRPDSDVICIDIDVTREDGLHNEVTLEPWATGGGVDVRVDGVLAARVKGASRIRPDQIRLLPRTRTGEAARIHRLTL